ncbi:unnamed protein product [Lathyrus sativus]|nr:unnamed protein product [Lathyrus sativus]
MANLSQADSRRMYSWWWDSHISPKNSKWLQENITDMDFKVKQMIKLIEEDADSFARRAEMYYKKRPELMKMVEESYRAYRALAERYDHATGVIRQAHRTMSEAFPNQVPMMITDDMETEPRTPETRHPSHAFLDSDELEKDAHVIKRNGAHSEEPYSPLNNTGLRQLNNLSIPREHAKFAEGRARRGLNFLETEEETSELKNGSQNTKAQVSSESGRVAKAEAEISALKEALAKLEEEKEAGLLQYQKSLEKLSNLELEVSSAQEYYQKLDERASKSDTEVQSLKEAVIKLQIEKETYHLQYQECLEKITDLERSVSSAEKDAEEFNERATKAETEVESLKQDLVRVEAEKEAALAEYKQCLETLSKLEKRLKESEENARRINEQATIANKEIEALKLEVTKLSEEKEDNALRYQQCLEIISSLEHKLSCAEEEVRRLNSKIDDEVEKLHSSEQKCLLLETSNHALQSELQSLEQKMGSQSEELNEKQQELSKLWNRVQEERRHFIEAETAFQTLQHLHSQSQEELRSFAANLHSKVELLRNMESCKQALEDEVHRVNEENQILNEVKISSSLSIKTLQDEILNLKDTIEKLEQEVELRLDERNALQQEIYCLKEELNGVNKKHEAMMEEVRSADLDPQCFGSSVKKLQDENSKLNETCEAEKDEKIALLVKLETMEKLLEKNSVLENSISELNSELDSLRGKVNVLEETCQTLLAEKSTLAADKDTLFSQLQAATEKLEKLSENNNLLENSLFDVNAELDGLRVKSKVLQDTCQLLEHEKSSIFSEKESLVSELNTTHRMLNDLEKKHGELELMYSELKGERASALQKVEELLVSLYSQREEHCRVLKLNEDEVANKELQIHTMQEDAKCRKEEYNEELDKAIHTQIEIFILQKFIQDLEKKNFSLLVESQRLLEASKMSDRMISKLETESIQKQDDVNSLAEKLKILRIGLLQVVKTLGINGDHYFFEDLLDEDETLLNHIHGKLKERQESFDTMFNENHHMVVQNSVLVSFLEQLKMKVENLEIEKGALDDESRIQSKKFMELQIEFQKILEMNREFKLTIIKGEERIEGMTAEMNNLHKELSDMEKSHKNLQEENCTIFEEKNSLMGRFKNQAEEKGNLEKEICVMFHEILVQSNISVVYQNIIFEKLRELEQLGEELDKLGSKNNNLEERLKIMAHKLENEEKENSHLKELFVKSNVELSLVESVNDQLNCQIRNEKEMLCQKEIVLLEAAKTFHALQTEKKELQRTVEDLKIRYDDAKEKLEEQANQNFKLSSDKDHQNEELGALYEANQNLEFLMKRLHHELEETKMREKTLNYEVREGINEIEQWETQATALYAELQISAVNETLFEGKACELADTCEDLERINNSKEMESEQMKELVSKLEGENARLCGQLAAYVPAISALSDCVTSLEAQTLGHAKHHDYEKPEVKNSVNHEYTENGQQIDEDQVVRKPDPLLEFQNLQRRINEISVAVNSLNGSFIRENEMREVQEAKENSRPDNPVTEIEVLPKDIMLDHISESSSYGISRRGTHEPDDHMLELWETSDKTPKMAAEPVEDHHQRGMAKNPYNKHPSGDSLLEKELSVDKLEISRRLSRPREEGNKSKVLERLDSDAQKLSNLQITIQDLMKKVETTEKSTKRKGAEYDTVKGQLEAAQETVTKLFDANRKLMKNVEDGALSSAGQAAGESDEIGSVSSRRRVSEQAQRGSEKIGQIQLEVQRLQFLLLKLNDGKEIKEKTGMADQSPRARLRDYLYGGTRTNHQKKKKTSFCACVRPPTKGD